MDHFSCGLLVAVPWASPQRLEANKHSCIEQQQLECDLGYLSSTIMLEYYIYICKYICNYVNINVNIYVNIYGNIAWYGAHVLERDMPTITSIHVGVCGQNCELPMHAYSVRASKSSWIRKNNKDNASVKLNTYIHTQEFFDFLVYQPNDPWRLYPNIPGRVILYVFHSINHSLGWDQSHESPFEPRKKSSYTFHWILVV